MDWLPKQQFQLKRTICHSDYRLLHSSCILLISDIMHASDHILSDSLMGIKLV